MSIDPDAPPVAANPYVGPQSFRRGNRLYGRDRAAAELLDLLVAERIVLLHSPSGAGKTSLIQARMLGLFEDERFDVLPVVRLTHELPPEAGALGGPTNRYVLSTLLSLEERLPRESQRATAELAGLTLSQYLADRSDLEGRPRNTVIVFDQFEEVITADPVDQDVKTAFVQQLGAVLRDRSVWALFSMREDFLAELDPYARHVPTRFANRYRLDLLTRDEAFDAIVRPAQDAGVEFRGDAANKLVDDLRRVRVQRGSIVVEELGPYVEPVQLQVACRGVWDRLDPDAHEIGLSDVEAVGDVNEALAIYYADCVESVANETSVAERSLREWIEEELITPQGFRGQAMHGPSSADGSDAGVLDRLTSAHLLRAESRRGAVWYELAHDRLIDPIKENNEEWRQQHLSDFERRARLWEEHGHPDSMLLTPQELDGSAAWTSGRPESLTEGETEFLAASRKAREQGEKEARANRRIRRWLIVAVVGLVLALVTSGLALTSTIRADRATLRATEAAILGQSLAQLDKDTQLSLRLAARAAALQDPDEDGLTIPTQNALQLGLSTSPVLRVIDDGQPSPTGTATSSRDGSRVAASHEDGSVTIYQAPKWGEVWRRSFPELENFALNTDGSRVAVAASGRVTVWTVDSSSPLEVKFKGGCGSLSFSPDGAWLACAAEDAVLVAQVANGQVRHRFGGVSVWDAQWAGQGAWAPGHAALVAAREEGLLVWESPSAPPRPVKVKATGPFAVSVRGGRLAISSQDGVEVYADLGRRRLSSFVLGEDRGATDLSFNQDGSFLAVVDSQDGLSLRDATTGDELRRASQAGTYLGGAELRPSADQAIVFDGAGTVTVWDVAAGHQDEEPSFGVTDDGRATTMSGLGGKVRFWSADGRPTAELDLAARLGLWSKPVQSKNPAEESVELWFGGAAVDPRGAYVVAVAPDGSPYVVSLDPKRKPVRLPTVQQDEGVHAVSTSLTGELVAGVFSEEPVLPEPLPPGSEQPPPEESVAPEDALGSDAAAVDGPSDIPPSGIYVWNAATGRQVARIETPGGMPFALQFSPDGKELVGMLGSDKGTQVTVWNIAMGRQRLAFTPPTNRSQGGSTTSPSSHPEPSSGEEPIDGDNVNAVAWAGDVIAGATQSEVQFWNARTGEPLGASFRVHSEVADIALSADGKRLLTAGLDKTVALWNVADHHLIRRVNHPTPVFQAAFGVGGRRLIVLGERGVPQIVWLDPRELLEQARARTTRPLTTSECVQYLGDESLCENN